MKQESFQAAAHAGHASSGGGADPTARSIRGPGPYCWTMMMTGEDVPRHIRGGYANSCYGSDIAVYIEVDWLQ